MDEHQFEFIGGNLALDFANTWGGLPAESPSQDRLSDYARLVLWSLQANLLNENEANTLLANADKAEASAVLEHAITVRETIRDVFLAIAKGDKPSAQDLELLNHEIEQGMAGSHIIPTSDGFAWEWRKEEGNLGQMLAPVARSAAMLLTSAEHLLVRKCGNEQCRWLFVDTTKNHRRRWCKTDGCGNVMRVRKHRERQSNKE